MTPVLRVALDSDTPTRKPEPTAPKALDARTETTVNISPGLAATYWLLASFATATAWAYIVPKVKRAAHNATARCHCGTCQR